MQLVPQRTPSPVPPLPSPTPPRPCHLGRSVAALLRCLVERPAFRTTATPGAPPSTPSGRMGQRQPPPTPNSSPTSTRPATPRHRSLLRPRRSSSCACSATATLRSSPSSTPKCEPSSPPTKLQPSKPSSLTRHLFSNPTETPNEPYAQTLRRRSTHPCSCRSGCVRAKHRHQTRGIQAGGASLLSAAAGHQSVRLQNLLPLQRLSDERRQRDPHCPAQHARALEQALPCLFPERDRGLCSARA